MDFNGIYQKNIAAGLIGLLLFALPAVVSALTPEQVVALKKAGVDEGTIRLMIQQENTARANPDDTMGRREVRDDQGNAVIIYSTGRSSWEKKDEQERKKVDNSWKMLQNMIIDGRSKAGSAPNAAAGANAITK